jgi:hypothetical protein
MHEKFSRLNKKYQTKSTEMKKHHASAYPEEKEQLANKRRNGTYLYW